MIRGRWGVVVAAALVSGVLSPVASAETGAKVLPTLLIKGEVVSVDTADPAATLLKVKDRYGFETPIYVTAETQISQGSQSLALANVSTGAAVEVEYNFDVNTAKRHAVTVKLASAEPAAEEAAPAAPEPVAPEAAVPAPAAETPAAPAEAMPAEEAMPDAAAEAPAEPEAVPAAE
jgi:hypothetical protein